MNEYILVIFAVLIQACNLKICWKECKDSAIIQSVELQGCHRRSTYPHKQDFWCDKNRGPPCTLLRGETAVMKIVWKDFGHRHLTQAVYWQPEFMDVDIPWVGMDTEACKYVNNGTSCPGKGLTPEKEGLSQLSFPIDVLEIYPTGTKNLKWEMYDQNEDGSSKTVFCFQFPLRIM